MHYGILVPVVHEAVNIARQARRRLKVENKGDGSLVSNADREIEELMRAKLAGIVPGAAFWGEELGFEEPTEEGIWLIDPIDGTTNYVYGSPLWGISVGFYRNGKLRIGAIALPDLDEIYFGGEGLGVHCNDVPVTPPLAGEIDASDPVGYCETVSRLSLNIPGKQRCLGAFVADGIFALRGRFRAYMGVRQMLYDIAPGVLFARELNMDVRYLDGGELNVGDLLNGKAISRPWGILPKGCSFTVDEEALATAQKPDTLL